MKSKTYLVLSILSYVLPVIIFGHWSIYGSIYFLFSILTLVFLINLKAIEGKDWPTWIYSAFHGMSLAIFGITICGFSQTGTLISLSNYHWGILVYLCSSLPFILLSQHYRSVKKIDYEKSFEGNMAAIERDKKINKILNHF
jgi:hypothetical protein